MNSSVNWLSINDWWLLIKAKILTKNMQPEKNCAGLLCDYTTWQEAMLQNDSDLQLRNG